MKIIPIDQTQMRFSRQLIGAAVLQVHSLRIRMTFTHIASRSQKSRRKVAAGTEHSVQEVTWRENQKELQEKVQRYAQMKTRTKNLKVEYS